MDGAFKDFMGRFFKAVRESDAGFLKGVYSDWFASSEVMPGAPFEAFLEAAMPDLKGVAECTLAGDECFGDFCVAKLRGPDNSESSISFRRKGDSFVFFNARSGYASFKRAYALGYSVEGGGVRILFNGRRHPDVYEIRSSGAVSLINSALVPGDNEITLEPLGGGVRASIRVSSAEKDGVINSAQGDALSWDGEVAGPVTLRFRAE